MKTILFTVVWVVIVYAFVNADVCASPVQP